MGVTGKDKNEQTHFIGHLPDVKNQALKGRSNGGTWNFAPHKQKHYLLREIHKNVDKAVDKPVDDYRKFTVVFNLDHFAYDLGTQYVQYN